MKNQNNRLTRDKILFESIYRELGDLESDKKRKKRIRDYTEIILTHFISMGYIVPPKVMQGQFTIHLHSKNSCFQPVSALDTPPPKIIVYGTSSKRLDDSRNI